jgi:hypothetical protein
MKCDICGQEIKDKAVFTIDLCKIGKSLDIEQTVDVCPGCLEKKPKKIFGQFKEVLEEIQ